MRGECVNSHAGNDSNGGTRRNTKVLHIACSISKEWAYSSAPDPESEASVGSLDAVATSASSIESVRKAGPGHVTTLMQDHLSDIIFLHLTDAQVIIIN
jgi:hypothetical protein